MVLYVIYVMFEYQSTKKFEDKTYSDKYLYSVCTVQYTRTNIQFIKI
jgi:hypothetical protein